MTGRSGVSAQSLIAAQLINSSGAIVEGVVDTLGELGWPATMVGSKSDRDCATAWEGETIAPRLEESSE